MNRFFDIAGDLSRQLAPWELKRLGINPKFAHFQLCEVIRFRSDIAGGVVRVPLGFISDLASIPQFAWSIFMAADDPRIELGAWVHDRLYSRAGKIVLEDGTRITLTREEADRILTEEAMPELEATTFQRASVYRALRWFGDRWK